ncbi:MAG TPA: dihydropteroate synthase [Acetobacteraceae bacterium]|nr:dihydropteroate synthase [Acetobacteraceae bacterium]
MLRLVEPLGLIEGPGAAEAISAGTALPLLGGSLAFSLARLLPDRKLVPAADIPPAWDEALARLTGPPSPFWRDRPTVMGVLNITPDSFSDGGRHLDPEHAIAAGLAMIAAGAAILDVGGESTRPGAALTPPEIEQARILPVIRGLAGQGVTVSVDTRNAATMEAALAAGAAIVNDISGLTHDPAAAPLLAGCRVPVVLMHMRGTPQTMAGLARYGDVAVEVVEELAQRLAAAEKAGIARDRIALDPGIGFAKTAAHSLSLLARLPLLLNLGCPLLLGVSRKSFIGRVSGVAEPRGRLAGSLAAALFVLRNGASVLRVHDVADAVQAVRVWQALACGEVPEADTPASLAVAGG